MADGEDFDTDFAPCPRCSGWGHIDCHCGGDLCVCDNYGERDCPLCHGEGVITEEQHARWTEAKRQHDADFAAARAAYEKEQSDG